MLKRKKWIGELKRLLAGLEVNRFDMLLWIDLTLADDLHKILTPDEAIDWMLDLGGS